MDTLKGWSKLCPDLLGKIFETLSPIESHRAKFVCSHWYDTWKTCLNRYLCPLRIIHQGDSLNPKQDSKFFVKRLFQLTHKKIASSGNWLLMVDYFLSFHLLNMLTCEKINLPSLRSQIHYEQDHVSKSILGCNNSAVLWINERTDDYVVALIFRQHKLLSFKKGDVSWRNLKFEGTNSGFMDLAFKNSKLYVFTADYHIKILDFFRHSPEKEFEKNPYRNHPFNFVEQPWERIWKRKIAIQKSGEVLIILSLKEKKYQERLLFYIFKMNLESYKWEKVDSIGDNEMLIFGHGVIESAPVKDCGDGIKSNSIYFVDDDVWPDHQDHDVRVSNCGVFDIATSSIEWPKKHCFYINQTQWFVPGVVY